MCYLPSTQQKLDLRETREKYASKNPLAINFFKCLHIIIVVHLQHLPFLKTEVILQVTESGDKGSIMIM